MTPTAALRGSNSTIEIISCGTLTPTRPIRRTQASDIAAAAAVEIERARVAERERAQHAVTEANAERAAAVRNAEEMVRERQQREQREQQKIKFLEEALSRMSQKNLDSKCCVCSADVESRETTRNDVPPARFASQRRANWPIYNRGSGKRRTTRRRASCRLSSTRQRGISSAFRKKSKTRKPNSTCTATK